MNKDRRKLIEVALTKIEEAKQDLEQARDEEQEYFDNMPENMQEGEKGEKAQVAIYALDDMVSNLDSDIDIVRGAIE